MSTQTERIASLEADNRNLASRMDRLESNQRFTIGLMVVLHGVTISAIFAAAALF